MADTLIIRDVRPETKSALRLRAKRNGRSMAAEVRMILDAATATSTRPQNALEFIDQLIPVDCRVEGGIDGLYEESEPAKPANFE